jgi:hypothetical protein
MIIERASSSMRNLLPSRSLAFSMSRQGCRKRITIPPKFIISNKKRSAEGQDWKRFLIENS